MDVDLDVLNFNWSIWTKGRKKLIKIWVWQVLGHHKYPQSQFGSKCRVHETVTYGNLSGTIRSAVPLLNIIVDKTVKFDHSMAKG